MSPKVEGLGSVVEAPVDFNSTVEGHAAGMAKNNTYHIGLNAWQAGRDTHRHEGYESQDIVHFMGVEVRLSRAAGKRVDHGDLRTLKLPGIDEEALLSNDGCLDECLAP